MYKELIRKKYGNTDKLEKYVSLIEEKNKVMNLTGFSGERLWQEGIYESLLILEEIKEGSLLDIGAGAGFPSIPFLLVNKNIFLTIYEPLEKRVKFLNEVKEELNLDVDIVNQRIEESKLSEKFDYVTARAVAPLKILIEISHKSLKIGGTMIFPKGKNYQIEIDEAKWIMNKLNLKHEIKEINIGQIKTYLIKIIKLSKTPKGIPRRWAQIKADKKV